MSPGLAKGEIWWADLGKPQGHGQAGHRPAIVLADLPSSKSVVVVPMTTTLDRTKFAYTFTVEPDSTNGLKERSVALVFQVRHLDQEYLTGRAGRLAKPDLDKLDALLADMLQIGA